MPPESIAPQEVMQALLETIVPSRDSLAGAGTLGLASYVVEDADDQAKRNALEIICAKLPTNFTDLMSLQREQALVDIEREHSNEFALVVNMIYTAYYSDQRVLIAIAEDTGYNPEPPQPAGYELAAFDERLLEPVKQRPPRWKVVD